MFIANRKLRQARPSLSLKAPLTHKIVWGFVVFNLWIAYSIYSQVNLVSPVVVWWFTQEFWTGVFAFLSLSLWFGIYLNDWRLIKWSMSLGLLVKSVWTYALIVMGIQYGLAAVSGIIGLWLFATWIQLICLIYFTPNGTVYERPHS